MKGLGGRRRGRGAEADRTVVLRPRPAHLPVPGGLARPELGDPAGLASAARGRGRVDVRASVTGSLQPGSCSGPGGGVQPCLALNFFILAFVQ